METTTNRAQATESREDLHVDLEAIWHDLDDTGKLLFQVLIEAIRKPEVATTLSEQLDRIKQFHASA